MEIPRINLYIDTSVCGPAIKIRGYYMYLLEYVWRDQPVTMGKIGKLTECTENQLALTALSEALKRVTKRSRINVFCTCGHVTGAIQNGWVASWREREWKNAKGQPVKNADLWKQVQEQWKDHIITAQPGSHSYSAWMRAEMEREERNDSERAVEARDANRNMGKRRSPVKKAR